MTDQGVTASARFRILALTLATLATVLLLVISGALGLNLVHRQILLLNSGVDPAAQANRQALQAMTDSESGLRGYLLTQDQDFLKPYKKARAPLDRTLEQLDQAAQDDPDLQTKVDRQRTAVQTWFDGYAEPIVQGVPGSRSPLRQAVGQAAFESFRDANGDLTTALDARREALVATSSRNLRNAVAVLVLITAAGAAVMLVLAVRAMRGIGPPLEALQRTVGQLRAGHLSARADLDSGVEEIRSVSAALNELAAGTEQRQAEDAEEIRLAESVREIGLAIDTLDPEAVVGQGIESIAVAFGASGLWITTFASAGPLPGPASGAVFPPRPMEAGPPALVAALQRIAELAWRREEFCLLGRGLEPQPDYLSAEETEAMLAIAGARVEADHALLVPVGAGSQCLGWMALSRRADEPAWSHAEITAAQRVGRDVGQAALRARIFARERELIGELQNLDNRKSDFVSMVSHELRTPLASIIGHLEIVRSGDLGRVDPQMDGSLAAIDRNAFRLTALIEDLLMLSRIEQRALPADLVPIDLRTVAGEVIAMHEASAESHGVSLAYESSVERSDASRDARVLGDEQELERVVSNLVGNAIKYSPSDTTVVVRVDPGDSDVTIAVQDQGLGISDADQTRLFERFFRSTNPEAHAVPGTGLGLAITKLVLERHGGTITVDSALGHGSTFTVRLPRSGPQPKAEDPAVTTPTSPLSATPEPASVDA